MNSDFVIEDNILIEYTGKDKIVKIPKNITIIEEDVFANNDTIEKVILPQNLEKICSNAFKNCYNLKEINLENVKEININAFKFCESLTDINLLNISNLSDGSFDYCKNLKNIKIKIKGIKQDIGCAFSECENLTSIKIDNATINSINKIIGVHNPNLTEVIGNNIICENRVVYNKDKTILIGYLESKQDKYFKIPDTVKNIYETAILNNPYLKTLEFGKNVEIINECAINCELENIIVNKKLAKLSQNCICNSCKLKILDLRKTQIKEFEQTFVENCSCKIFLPIDIKYIEVNSGYGNKIIINKKSNPVITGSRKQIEYEKDLEELLEEGKTFREASQIIKNQER